MQLPFLKFFFVAYIFYMHFLQLLYILPLLTNIPYMKFTFIARSVHTAAKQCYLPHGTAICRTCLANPVTAAKIFATMSIQVSPHR